MKFSLIGIFALVLWYGCLSKSSKGASTLDKEEQIKAIKTFYADWINGMIKKGDYWPIAKKKAYSEEWHAKSDFDDDEYLAGCLDGIDEELTYEHYGDINHDNRLDCVTHMQPNFCMEGTATMFEDIRHIFILSEGADKYKMIINPDVVVDNIGVWGASDSIMTDGLIVYTGVEHGEGDAHAPTHKFRATFRYQNGKFKKVKE